MWLISVRSALARRVVTPGGVKKAVDRDNRAGPDQKRAENPARNRSPHSHRPVRALNLQRAQNPQHHSLTVLAIVCGGDGHHPIDNRSGPSSMIGVMASRPFVLRS